MSDIDFLGKKKSDDDQASGRKPDKKEKLIWSNPEEQPAAHKGSAFSFLPFLDKKNKSTASLGSKTAIDKNKIKQSRQEILRLIKNRESSAAKDNKPTSKNILSSWGEKFKKQFDQKEILVDYQKVFNQEKIKRSQAGQIIETQPESSGKQAPPGQAKEPKHSWFGEFIISIREKLSAMFPPSSPSPAKLNSPTIVKSSPPKPEPPLIKDNLPETKKEEKILAQTESATETTSVSDETPRVLETNLIKGEIITFFDWPRKAKFSVGAFLISIFLVSIVYFGLEIYQKQSQAENQIQINKFNRLIEEVKNEETGLKEITEFQTRLKKVSQIFSKHIYWTNFFKFLEDNTLKEVYYAGFSGDTGGNYELDATAESFTNISEQTDIFQNNDKISKVLVTGGELLEGNKNNQPLVKFILDFSIIKSIFTE
jgi:hypothetical protein